jgi:hypothetical protein
MFPWWFSGAVADLSGDSLVIAVATGVGLLHVLCFDVTTEVTHVS